MTTMTTMTIMTTMTTMTTMIKPRSRRVSLSLARCKMLAYHQALQLACRPWLRPPQPSVERCAELNWWTEMMAGTDVCHRLLAPKQETPKQATFQRSPNEPVPPWVPFPWHRPVLLCTNPRQNGRNGLVSKPIMTTMTTMTTVLIPILDLTKGFRKPRLPQRLCHHLQPTTATAPP